jgi:hypothetical protein
MLTEERNIEKSLILLCAEYLSLRVHIRHLVAVYGTKSKVAVLLDALWTGDADLRFYITTVQDG